MKSIELMVLCDNHEIGKIIKGEKKIERRVFVNVEQICSVQESPPNCTPTMCWITTSGDRGDDIIGCLNSYDIVIKKIKDA